MGDHVKRTRVESLPAEELTRILGQLGHEVGTPLGSLLMMAEMIADGAGVDAGLRRRAKGLKQAATEIRDVVQPFVRLLRLRTGWFGPAPAAARGDEIARTIHRAAELAGPAVTVTDPASGPLPNGRVDLDYLREALELCCAWAASRSEGGVLRVDIEADASGNEVRCEISYAGSEIPWGEPAILDPLGAGELGLCRRVGGAGLQLALARMLVWRLGGELTGRFEHAENILSLRLPSAPVDPLG